MQLSELDPVRIEANVSETGKSFGYDGSLMAISGELTSLKKTKAAKINYLVKEIPDQFLDDFRFMMNEKDREIIINLCQNKQIKSFDALIHLMEFGYVFLTPSGTVVFPQELQWFITDLFM